jgi:aminotransferase
VVISGLSKTHAMTGWRIGWAIAPPALAGPLAAVHQHLVTCAPSVSQGAALAALSMAGIRAACRIRDRLARGRELMARELESVPGIRYHRPDGGFYYFIQVSGCTDSEQLARKILKREQVITIPGAAFGPGGEGCLRLSFAATDEEIAAGVAGIRRVLGG